jgi:hypothetical protein
MPFNVTSRPAVRGRVLSKIPATFSATGGLDITKTNGVWTLSPDLETLNEVGSISDAGVLFTWVWNSETGAYSRISFQTVISEVESQAGLAAPTGGTLTIATGTVTKTANYHTIDTEAAAASDDLDTINGGSDGDILVISAANSARTVVARDGIGNLQLNGNMSLDNAQDTLTLIYVAALTAWLELARSNNGT